MNSELEASSNEEDSVAVADAGILADLEACSDHETSKEQDTPSSLVADPEGMPVSVHSSSEWEAVTTPYATVLGVALAARAARDGIEVPVCTYSRSRSTSEPITSGHTGRQTLIARVNRLDLVLVP